MVSVAFTGFDRVDLDLCRGRGIAVYNVPDYSTDSVAELTLGLALALCRNIPIADSQVRDGHWVMDGPGSELAGKKVGILGTGSIGLRVAELYAAFKCRIVGWSRTRREAFICLGGEYRDSVTDVCSGCDLLSVHLPLNSDTNGIIGSRELTVMPKHAYLINTARAAVVDSIALAEALKAKRIAGAAIDVFDTEPVSPHNPLLKLSTILLTPHIGYFTSEALVRRAEIAVSNIQRFLSGDSLNRVL
jgi:D-3-phosphoglycerate dehydrogenase